jgi:uncharacterized protein YecE (DUF72 family)
MAFDRAQMKNKAAELAAKGVYVGTSSWKYEGWFGQLYTPARYEYRGKVARTRFERDCLGEYAEVFKTVSVDAAYYTFPSPAYLQKLADAVPADFRFGFKVTDTVTIKKFPNVARFGTKAGQRNPDFLNADLFATAFLKPCEGIRAKVGVLMFEFSRFWPSDYEHGRDFVAELDAFLGKLPKNWPYAIEMRNKHWLTTEYFGCLSRHSNANWPPAGGAGSYWVENVFKVSSSDSMTERSNGWVRSENLAPSHTRNSSGARQKKAVRATAVSSADSWQSMVTEGARLPCAQPGGSSAQARPGLAASHNNRASE